MHRSYAAALLLMLATVLAVSAGCEKDRPRPSATVPAGSDVKIAPPLPASVDPIAAAEAVKLAPREAEELPGLHHVQRLSANFISGSEPFGPRAFETLASLGVKSVLSVDGKTPDIEGAAKHGLTYVHLPIQYKGIPADVAAKILKSFRELPKPFYVHCFHGLHRGPAAAALGRLAIDGAGREQALAEMLVWCGTSKGYPGLYATVARLDVPSASETAALKWDFRSPPEEGGIQQSMVTVSRADDALKRLAKVGFGTDPEHPDVDGVNEATILAQAFERCAKGEDACCQPADFQAWLKDSAKSARQLATEITSMRAATTDDARDAARKSADASWKQISASCKDCHKSYRDK